MKSIALFLCLCILLPLATVSAATTPSADKETILRTLYESDISTARQALDEGLITCVELTHTYQPHGSDRLETKYRRFNALYKAALEIGKI